MILGKLMWNFLNYILVKIKWFRPLKFLKNQFVKISMIMFRLVKFNSFQSFKRLYKFIKKN